VPKVLAPATLQWGRGFSAAEGDSVEPVRDSVCMLQWGRGFSAAEGVFNYSVMLPRDIGASMGPRLLSRGGGQRPDILAYGYSASMGPRLLSRGGFQTGE